MPGWPPDKIESDARMKSSPARSPRDPSPGASFRPVILVLSGLVAAGFFFYLCAFKVVDFDFWWHVKAGEIMWRTKSLITTDPFAYTRAGEPFLPRYEWLAQIILYLLYQSTGATGIILLRSCLVALAFCALLAIDPDRLWPNCFLAIWAGVACAAGLTERPHLFSYALFSLFLVLAIRSLELEEEEPQRRAAWDRRFFLSVFLLQILWVNLHGAACVMGIAVVGSLWLENASDSLRKRRWSPGTRDLAVLIVALIAATLISPNTYHNLSYAFHLTSDKSTPLISEWQPRDIRAHFAVFAPFWLMGSLSILLGRRGRAFSSVLLVATGALALLSRRHEPFFVLACVGVVLFQLKGSELYRRLVASCLKARAAAVLCSAILVAVLGSWAHARWIRIFQIEHVFSLGYGQFSRAQGAFDFIERSGIRGPMFNTYEIGGYLIFRGYPDRKVFVDGRNVDYGFEFLNRAFRAGRDRFAWDELCRRYRFDYAVIDLTLRSKLSFFPYQVHLADDPHWKLVYLDDWVAVYLKDTPENAPVIRRFEYRLLSPQGLAGNALLRSTPRQSVPLLEAELQRAVRDNPVAVQAKLLLALLYLDSKRLEQALPLLEEARKAQPLRAAVHQVLWLAYETKKDWAKAALSCRSYLDLASHSPAEYQRAGDFFARAGDMSMAKRCWRKAASGS